MIGNSSRVGTLKSCHYWDSAQMMGLKHELSTPDRGWEEKNKKKEKRKRKIARKIDVEKVYIQAISNKRLTHEVTPMMKLFMK